MQGPGRFWLKCFVLGGVGSGDLKLPESRERNFAMRLLLIALFALVLTFESKTACVCRCVDGAMQPLCESSIDLPPICPAAACP